MEKVRSLTGTGTGTPCLHLTDDAGNTWTLCQTSVTDAPPPTGMWGNEPIWGDGTDGADRAWDGSINPFAVILLALAGVAWCVVRWGRRSRGNQAWRERERRW